ncbi:CD225/dispanin family protein [Nocardiopsis sp. EMB25]|uniref:CD225/dispanin family protein n=1 Tax=Nocardiopsis TaxID=2013 RepID=UPI00034688E4|nr:MULTISPECIES: CD225/dispanin family protein [Nocardiopsis]MCY9782969.1 CD225/dispanin family protein [Nocardiopsis sp. EMB25]
MSYGPPPPGNPGPPPPPPGGGYGPPPGNGGYGPPPGGTGGYGAMPPSAEPPKNFLVFNILGLFGCTILAIVGLVFAIQVNSKWQAGDYAGAESAAKTAKILGIISFIGFCLTVVYVVLMILGAVVAGTSGY